MRYQVWLSLLVTFTLLPSPAFGDGDLTLEQVRAKMDAASATIPDNSVETQVTTMGSLRFQAVTFRRGANKRTVDGVGPTHSERGVFQGEAWRQTANGLTVIDTPLADDTPAPSISLTRVTTPFDAYRITSDDHRGTLQRDYVDPVSFLVRRRDTVAAWGTVITTYDDFQPIGNGQLPMHWRIDDRHQLTVSDVRRTIARIGSVTDADVQEPPTRRALAEFERTEPTVVPSVFTGNHVFVRATVAGHPVELGLDTGASGIVLDGAFARSIGLVAQNSRPDASNARVTDVAEASVPTINVGSATMRNIVVGLTDLSQFNGPGHLEIVGLLGFDFFASVCTSIDFEHNTVTVRPYEQFRPPAPSAAIALPIKLGSLIPQVAVGINGYVADGFTFDTGADTAFVITPNYTRRHRDIGHVIESGSMEGIGGNVVVQHVQIESLRLGPIEYRNFVGTYVPNDASYAEVPGFIGEELIRNFNIDLDYVDAAIYLTPNANARRYRVR